MKLYNFKAIPNTLPIFKQIITQQKNTDSSEADFEIFTNSLQNPAFHDALL